MSPSPPPISITNWDWNASLYMRLAISLGLGQTIPYHLCKRMRLNFSIQNEYLEGLIGIMPTNGAMPASDLMCSSKLFAQSLCLYTWRRLTVCAVSREPNCKYKHSEVHGFLFEYKVLEPVDASEWCVTHYSLPHPFASLLSGHWPFRLQAVSMLRSVYSLGNSRWHCQNK